MKKPFRFLLIIFTGFLFCFTGCSHSAKQTGLPDNRAIQEPTAINSANAAAESEPVVSDSEIPDEFSEFGETDEFDSFFEDSGFDQQSKQYVPVSDPLYFWNKPVFVLNDKMYFWVIKPLATGYKKITPNFFRQGLKNFFQNLKTPVRLVNAMLQGNAVGCSEEFERFIINSTLGIGGLFNLSDTYFEMKPCDEDFGQTLGKYGVGSGCYVVWPFIGPSTIRDTLGFGADAFLDPTSYIEPWESALAVSAGSIVNAASFRLGEYEAVTDTAIDPYVMIRDIYLKYRAKKVED